jgi:hypothetical protein
MTFNDICRRSDGRRVGSAQCGHAARLSLITEAHDKTSTKMGSIPIPEQDTADEEHTSQVTPAELVRRRQSSTRAITSEGCRIGSGAHATLVELAAADAGHRNRQYPWTVRSGRPEMGDEPQSMRRLLTSPLQAEPYTAYSNLGPPCGLARAPTKPRRVLRVDR